MDAEKPLRGAGRFEALHFPLPPSHDLVRVLGAIVHPLPLLMTAGQAKGLERGGIGAQHGKKHAMSENMPCCLIGMEACVRVSPLQDCRVPRPRLDLTLRWRKDRPGLLGAAFHDG